MRLHLLRCSANLQNAISLHLLPLHSLFVDLLDRLVLLDSIKDSAFESLVTEAAQSACRLYAEKGPEGAQGLEEEVAAAQVGSTQGSSACAQAGHTAANVS